MAYYKHGETTSGSWTLEYISWMRMRQRCLDPNTGYYRLWGGRGITFDPAWGDYKIFLKDMGRRPSLQHSLERINNNLGYSKNNCRWATPKEQARNRRDNKLDQIMVNHIRSLYKLGQTQQAIATLYGISQTYVGKLIRWERWK